MLEWQMSRALVLPLHPHMKESKTKIIMDFSDFSIGYKTVNQSHQILTHSTLFMWANYLCKHTRTNLIKRTRFFPNL